MKKLVLISLCIISLLTGYAQDAHFSLYNNSRLYINPAFAGTDSTFVISSNFRLQWPNLSSSYRSLNFSADKYFRPIRGGLGLNYLYDIEMQGAYTKVRIDFTYAPHFELRKHKLVLVPAVQLGYFKNTIDYSKLTFGDMIDERRGFVYNTNEVPGSTIKSNVDLSTGLLLYSTTFFGGIAIHHINQPDEGFLGPSKLPMKITIHGGANLKLKKDSAGKFIFSPTLLYMQQQDFRILMPGVVAKYRFISLGISYRSEDAFITLLAVQFKNFKIGYSYDYTVSKLTNKSTGGSHEIGISGFLKSKKKLCKIKTLRLI